MLLEVVCYLDCVVRAFHCFTLVDQPELLNRSSVCLLIPEPPLGPGQEQIRNGGVTMSNCRAVRAFHPCRPVP